MQWTEVIFEKIFPKCPKDTLMWLTCFDVWGLSSVYLTDLNPNDANSRTGITSHPRTWFISRGLARIAQNMLPYKCIFNSCFSAQSFSPKRWDCNFSPVFWHNTWHQSGVLCVAQSMGRPSTRPHHKCSVWAFVTSLCLLFLHRHTPSARFYPLLHEDPPSGKNTTKIIQIKVKGVHHSSMLLTDNLLTPQLRTFMLFPHLDLRN